VTPDAKFVDLGADSLDTVSSNEASFVCKLSDLNGIAFQVEIMMALEEKFDLQLDEEGETWPLLISPHLASLLSLFCRCREDLHCPGGC
jgi:hypothetical protein